LPRLAIKLATFADTGNFCRFSGGAWVICVGLGLEITRWEAAEAGLYPVSGDPD